MAAPSKVDESDGSNGAETVEVATSNADVAAAGQAAQTTLHDGAARPSSGQQAPSWQMCEAIHRSDADAWAMPNSATSASIAIRHNGLCLRMATTISFTAPVGNGTGTAIKGL
jgi:hypothetical protein